ncbi:MAG: glycosyltransferase family 2 protein, partial [bacterium]
MSRPITAFLPYSGQHFTKSAVGQLNQSGLVQKIFLLTTDKELQPIEGCETLAVQSLTGSKTMEMMAKKSSTAFSLFLLHDTAIEFGQFGLERFLNVAGMTNAGLLYSDYYDIKMSARTSHPLTDYQSGSIRDDFNFGSVVMMRSGALKDALSSLNSSGYQFAGWYGVRLALSRHESVTRIGEFLYSKIESDLRRSGEKLFDYVDPKNRQVQVEMEVVATNHLKKIDAYLKPAFKEVNLKEGTFAVEASVVIPVRNRVKTIRDAVDSVLN